MHMLPLDGELIKRVENGDILVRGIPDDILKSNFEDGWRVVHNLRTTEELELEKSGILVNITMGLAVKEKLPYREFIDNDWYILESSEWDR
jgi:hypothetical protein